MMKVGIVFAAALFALSVQATVRPVWEEPDQEGKGAEIRMLEDGSRIRVDRIAPEMVRVRRTKGKVWTESGMNRYGIIHRLPEPEGDSLVDVAVGADGTVKVTSKVSAAEMTIAKRERVHYGFLAPWSQANDWDSFHRPWMEGDEAERSFVHYDELRYSLFPYLYGTAAEAA